MNSFQKGILTLVRYALSPEESFPSLPDDFSYANALMFAGSQQIIPLLYYGACKTENFPASPIFPAFTARAGGVIAHSTRQIENFDSLTASLEAAGIDYMPVKGAILKRLYPQPEMRVMGDCDILIRQKQAKAARALMKRLDYHLEETTNHVFEYKKRRGHGCGAARQAVAGRRDRSGAVLR